MGKMLVDNDERKPLTFADILVQAGGDHQFDLGHLRRAGAVRLLQLLVHTAGFRPQTRWHLRVEKKIHCNGETKPITVVGSKPWCCYLKIKPGDNDTAHFCSLLMADGHRGEIVYEALKKAEEGANLGWRSGLEGKVMTMNNAAGVNGPGQNGGEPGPGARPQVEETTGTEAGVNGPGQTDEEPEPGARPQAEEAGGTEAGPSELRGWTDDPEKVRLTLLAIHEMFQAGQATDLDPFVAALADKLGWQGLRRKQIGGVFTALVRRGHIHRLRQGWRSLGYALTSEGQRLIQDLLPAGESVPLRADDRPLADHSPDVAPLPAAPQSDPARFVAALTELAKEYAAACQKLQENQTRRAQLLAEVERLDAEDAELDRVVNNPEVQPLLEKLFRINGVGGAAGQGS